MRCVCPASAAQSELCTSPMRTAALPGPRRASQESPVVKNLPAKERDTGDVGSIPGSGRSPGVGNSNALQYCCPENPMDRESSHGVTEGQTQRSTQHRHAPRPQEKLRHEAIAQRRPEIPSRRLEKPKSKRGSLGLHPDPRIPHQLGRSETREWEVLLDC